MEIRVKKTIETDTPVKAWKVVTYDRTNKRFDTGFLHYEPIHYDKWVRCTDNGTGGGSPAGYHAFRSYSHALRALLWLTRYGRLRRRTAFVVPCYVRGVVEFGKYTGLGTLVIKGVRASQILFKAKHQPNWPLPSERMSPAVVL
jgi:hypothetical protein